MRKKIAVKRVNIKELNLFDKVPNFSSMFYRFKHLKETILHYFIKKNSCFYKTF